MVLSTFYAATASDLIADIKASNLQGGANTIVLTAPTSSPYVMTATDNTTDGNTVLPVIAKGDNLTILTTNGSANPGYGDVINASSHGRLFDVAQGSSLTLENVTLQGGYLRYGRSAYGAMKGGAIYNQGTLVLSDVLVQNNAVYAYADASGGAIWSNSSLTLENSTLVRNNGASSLSANAYGGGIYIAAGTANITSTTFVSNSARAGSNGGPGGSAYGGAVYVAGGTVTMSGDTVGNLTPLWLVGPYSGGNDALGGGLSGNAYGGGLCIAGGTVTLTNDQIVGNYTTGYRDEGGGIYIAPNPSVTVYLDGFTKSNTRNNVYNPTEPPDWMGGDRSGESDIVY
jgi:hypothetical protein